MEDKKEIGKKVCIIGAGNDNHFLSEAIERTLAQTGIEENQIIDTTNDLNKLLDFSYVPEYIYTLNNLPSLLSSIYNTPNKLKLLKELNLSPEQIDYFKNAPPYRLPNETQDNYKQRRVLNKLLIKYRDCL